MEWVVAREVAVGRAVGFEVATAESCLLKVTHRGVDFGMVNQTKAIAMLTRELLTWGIKKSSVGFQTIAIAGW